MMMSQKEMLNRVGGIITGFGMLFVGLKMMSGSMEAFAELDAVKSFLAMIANPILLVLIGMILTAIIQSSSVMTSVAIAMVVAGLITLDQGIFLTMGSNIGSCVVAVIAGFTSGKNAKRTALIHLIFNCSGVVLFLLVHYILLLATGGTVSFGTLFNTLFPDAPQTQLAMFHTVFNCVTVALVLPLTNLLLKLVCFIIPGEERDLEDEPHLYFIDEHMLKSPAVAVLQTKNEILNMAEIALDNLHRSFDIVCTMNYDGVEKFRKNERELNFLNRELVRFVVKLSKEPHSDKDHAYLSTAFFTVLAFLLDGAL
jgi:phosphate:Na+ symporter